MSLLHKLGEENTSGDHSELWMVSYADLMTLLFGFFVILYSFSEINEAKFSDMTSQIAQSMGGDVAKTSAPELNAQERQARALQMLVSMNGAGKSVDETVNAIEQAHSTLAKSKMAKDSVIETLKIDKKQMESFLQVENGEKESFVNVVLPANLIFETGSDQLIRKATKEIHKLAVALAQMKNVLRIEIGGHTDSSPPSGQSRYMSNWALSSARAGAVAEELIRFGIPKQRIIVRGMADSEPLFPERRPDGSPDSANMAKNRRVQIVVRIDRSHD